ncbi:hypothetical protein KOW79_014278 [Hemibagrus wyckioides]|uniref:Uncharacterized protein n=1 Tax=Hemibagrus wyckioides TaxID=337641 RepID=A0A9D3NIK7_9TELE|nr:hypothetical protein KOW79_014278 [Hemibagrus wyckioides]
MTVAENEKTAGVLASSRLLRDQSVTGVQATPVTFDRTEHVAACGAVQQGVNTCRAESLVTVELQVESDVYQPFTCRYTRNYRFTSHPACLPACMHSTTPSTASPPLCLTDRVSSETLVTPLTPSRFTTTCTAPDSHSTNPNRVSASTAASLRTSFHTSALSFILQ